MRKRKSGPNNSPSQKVSTTTPTARNVSNHSICKKRKKEIAAEKSRSSTPSHTPGRTIEESGNSGSEARQLHLNIEPGEAYAIEGFMLARVVQGSAWVLGCPLVPSSGDVLILSNPRIGSAVVVEAPKEGLDPRNFVSDTHPAPPPTKHTEACILEMRPLHLALQPELTGAEIPAGSQGVHWESINSTAKLRPVTLPGPWRAAMTEIQHCVRPGELPPPVVVVAGPKGVGKSTLSRLTVNSMLATCHTVAYLDLDPGQPEMSFPGLLTLSLVRAPLLAPPQLRLLMAAATARIQSATASQVSALMPTVVGQFFVGDVKPEGDPTGFLEGICALQAMWAASLRESCIPLVVNTMGWVKGLGLNLLQATLTQVQPTHLLQVQSPSTSKNLPDDFTWKNPDEDSGEDGGTSDEAPQCTIIRLHTTAAAIDTGSGGFGAWDTAGMPSEASSAPSSGGHISQNASTLQATDSRALMWMALAEQLVLPRGTSPSCLGPASVWELAGAGMHLEEKGGGIAGGLSGRAFGVAAEELAAAIPYVVPLDSLKVTIMFEEVVQSEVLYTLNGAIVGLITNAGVPGSCLGMGLVRAVDAEKRRLYILTTVPHEQLARVCELRVGSLELPTRLLMSPNLSSPYISHHKWAIAGEGTGATVVRSRNNIRRTYTSVK